MTTHYATPDHNEPQLFNYGDFLLHSGTKSKFKIDCDALTDAELEALASIVTYSVSEPSYIHSIPKGGDRLAAILQRTAVSPRTFPTHLIIDDVFTTGTSMAIERGRLLQAGVAIEYIHGIVIFARANTPSWVHPLCTLTGLLGVNYHA